MLDAGDLPFERLCTHVPLERRDDPTPWPDVFIAFEGVLSVAVIVPGADGVPRAWRCRALPRFDGPRLNAAPGIPRPMRDDRAGRWNRVRRSAG